MPVLSLATSQNYPTLETVLNLVRAQCNDAFSGGTSTPGEGQILSDLLTGTTTNNPFVLALFNSAIRTLYRKLRNVGSPTLIKDNYLLTNLPMVNGPLGAGQPDPSVFVRLGFDGYDPGSGAVNAAFTLPADMIQPISLYERMNGSSDTFVRMRPSPAGLESRNQTSILYDWEWRGDSIFMNGATVNEDVRIRYQAEFPTFFASNLSFTNTQIPIFDCEEAVAYLTVAKIAGALGSPILAQAKAQASEELDDLRNQITRRMQNIQYARSPYRDDDSLGLDEYSI